MVNVILSILLLLTWGLHETTAQASKSASALAERPLVISICGYNTGGLVHKNLDSIFSQKYTNYRVVYIDDCSSDSTAHSVREYINSHNLHDKMTLIVNETRVRKMKNIYNFFHTCRDDEIIVQVDADDWLAHDKVFSLINEVYQKNDVWLTYGQFIGYPHNQPGLCKAVPKDVIKNRSFRQWDWVYTHLRTFEAWLFKSIKLEDFICELVPGFEGKFYPVANDAASYFPMLEMCGSKFAFIPEIIYIYNWDSPLRGGRVENKLYPPAVQDLKRRPLYPQSPERSINRLAQFKHAQTDVIVLAHSDIELLTQHILSINDNVKNVDRIHIVHQSTAQEAQRITDLEHAYENVYSVPVVHKPVDAIVQSLVEKSPHRHVILTHGRSIVTQPVHAQECIMELERTLAHCFYLGFSAQGLPFFDQETKSVELPYEHIYKNLCAWKFACSKKVSKPYNAYATPQTKVTHSHLINSLDMTLLRKSTVLEKLVTIRAKKGTAQSTSNEVTDFAQRWLTSPHTNFHNVGLFFRNQILERYTPSNGEITENPTFFTSRPVFHTHGIADLIIMSDNNAAELKTVLESLRVHATGIEKIYVLYGAAGNTNAYKQLETEYPSVDWFATSASTALITTLLGIIQRSSHNYIMISDAQAPVCSFVDIKQCAQHLETAQAYGCYLGISADDIRGAATSSIESQVPDHALHSWTFKDAWYPLCNNMTMTLMKKSYFKQRISCLASCKSIPQFITSWSKLTHARPEQTGLALQDSK